MQFSLLVAALSAVVSAASINPKDTGFVNSHFEELDVDSLPANVRLANASLKSNSKSLMNADAAATCPAKYPLYCRDYDFCCTRQAVGCCRNACCAKGATFCGTDGHCYAYT